MGKIRKCDIIDDKVIGYTIYSVCDMCKKENINSFDKVKFFNKRYDLCDDCIAQLKDIIKFFIGEEQKE